MDSTSDLWIDVIVDGEIVSPVVTRSQILPFDKLSWENFERLCYRLAWRNGEISDCHRYGVQGQAQKGIDLFFRDTEKGTYGTWQCKRHADFDATHIEAAVTKFLKHPWATKSKFFALAVTVDLTPTELTNEVVRQTDRCAKEGIVFEAFDQNRLSQSLKAHQDLVDDFFGRPWAIEFCGAEACKALVGRCLTKVQRLQVRKDLGELYAVHFATMDVGLPAAAGALGSSDKPLPLHKRYIFPKAEAVTTVTRKNVDNVKLGETGQPGEPKPTQATVSEGDGPFLGFRTFEHRTKADLFEWLIGTEQSVVIGEPGLGKSAMLRFIAADLLLDQPRSEPLARKWGSFLPVLIPFAVITRFVNRGESGGILEYLLLWLKEMNASADMLALFETALKDSRILLLVDGLDEWSDPVTASTAMTKLRTFAESRRLSAIATSRPIGHQRISGFLPTWKRADLLHFDPDQLRAFTLAWFEHFHFISQPTTEEGARLIASNRQADLFMDEIKQDSALFELATVPLLLSVLISLRLRGQVLPRNRYDALDAICKTLIQEQPQRRAQAALKNRGGLPLHSSVVEKGIYFLAFFVLGSPTSTGVKRDDARKSLAEFYSKEFRKTDADAYELAAAQVDFAADEIGLLIEPESETIGFLHRSIQEFLAARHLKSFSFADAKCFILENLTRVPWHETIVAFLSLTDRRDELDSITNDVRNTEFGPLHLHGIRLFLAKIAFRDFNLSPEVARTIAEETLSLIKASNWAPIRQALVREVMHGLSSESLRGLVEKFITRSFPRKTRWRSEIIKQLGKSPNDSFGRLLIHALHNSDSPHEKRDIAIAMRIRQAFVRR
jgi:hypothetical protein